MGLLRYEFLQVVLRAKGYVLKELQSVGGGTKKLRGREQGVSTPHEYSTPHSKSPLPEIPEKTITPPPHRRSIQPSTALRPAQDLLSSKSSSSRHRGCRELRRPRRKKQGWEYRGDVAMYTYRCPMRVTIWRGVYLSDI